jgi:uncharacterized protein (TIGR03083 family)
MDRWDRDAAVAAYVDALESMQSLAHEVELSRWADGTDLPGWTVQDNFSHLVSLETTLLGRADPEHEPDYDKLPHTGDDWVKRHIERGVDLRRSRHPADVLAEVDEVVAARLPEVRALPDDPEALVPGVLGKPRPVAAVVGVRTFDVWAHEQDVRRAVGLGQRLTGLSAEASRDRILMALPEVVAELGLHEGTTVRWIVTGPLAFTASVTVTDEGALAAEADADADATLTMDWSTFAILSCGRAEPSHVRVSVDGDVGLAEKVLPAMNITP